MTDQIKFRIIIFIPVLLFSLMILLFNGLILGTDSLNMSLFLAVGAAGALVLLNAVLNSGISRFRGENIPDPGKQSDYYLYFKKLGETPLF